MQGVGHVTQKSNRRRIDEGPGSRTRKSKQSQRLRKVSRGKRLVIIVVLLECCGYCFRLFSQVK